MCMRKVYRNEGVHIKNKMQQKTALFYTLVASSGVTTKPTTMNISESCTNASKRRFCHRTPARNKGQNKIESGFKSTRYSFDGQ